MSKEKTRVTYRGIGFIELLTLLFIALKLTKVITWSWWWVLSPVWISFGLAIGIILLLSIVAGLIAIFDKN